MTLHGSGSPYAIRTLAGFAPAVATGRSAAVEAASGMLSRALQAADVRGPEWALGALSPRIRSAIARGMVTYGQALLVLEVNQSGRVRFLPARGSVYGSPEPDSWVYWLSASGPSSPGPWRRYLRPEIMHPMYEADPDRPWQGVTPADGLDARLGALVSAALAREGAAPHGNVLVVRPATDPRSDEWGSAWGDEARQELKRQLPPNLGELSRGGLAILTVEDITVGQAESRQGTVARVGLAPPASVAQLYQEAFEMTLASFGVPPNVVTPTGYSRDALRQVEQHFLRPLIESVVAEASRVLEVDLELGPTTTRSPADWVSLGRAANSLRMAGYEPTKIEELLAL